MQKTKLLLFRLFFPDIKKKQLRKSYSPNKINSHRKLTNIVPSLIYLKKNTNLKKHLKKACVKSQSAC